MAYCCIMYYEVKEVHDLITFTATKRLNALIEVMTNILIVLSLSISISVF